MWLLKHPHRSMHVWSAAPPLGSQPTKTQGLSRITGEDSLPDCLHRLGTMVPVGFRCSGSNSLSSFHIQPSTPIA